MKDELGRKILKEFVGLKLKIYLFNLFNEYKKAKGTKKCVVKRKLKFEHCKHCLEASQFENKITHLEKK